MVANNTSALFVYRTGGGIGILLSYFILQLVKRRQIMMVVREVVGNAVNESNHNSGVSES